MVGAPWGQRTDMSSLQRLHTIVDETEFIEMLLLWSKK